MLGVRRNVCLCSSTDGSIGRIGRTSPGPDRPSLWRALQCWQRDRRAVAALQALDARTLKDIGIERSEIESVVRCDASRVKRT